MPPVGFEPTVPASERPEIHALRLRGHWDRKMYNYYNWKITVLYTYILHRVVSFPSQKFPVQFIINISHARNPCYETEIWMPANSKGLPTSLLPCVCVNSKRNMNALCGQNADVLNDRASGSYIYRWELAVKIFKFPVHCPIVLPFLRHCLTSA
jgi:hypothetical protein